MPMNVFCAAKSASADLGATLVSVGSASITPAPVRKCRRLTRFHFMTQRLPGWRSLLDPAMTERRSERARAEHALDRARGTARALAERRERAGVALGISLSPGDELEIVPYEALVRVAGLGELDAELD